MASVKETISDERSFILSALKFTFQVTHHYRRYPNALEKELKELEEQQSIHFTNSVIKVMMIFIDEFYAEFKNIGHTNEEDINRMKTDLRRKFNHCDFLHFLTLYLLKCASISPNFYYEEVILDIESWFSYVHRHGSWAGMDEAASLYLVQGAQKCEVLPKREYLGKINVSAEEEFVIKLLIHVFFLEGKEAPSYLQSRLIYYTTPKPDPFTEEVKQALHILFKNQEANEEIRGFMTLEAYYQEGKLETFDSREYLEYCVLYARRAVLDYTQGSHRVPAKIFQKLTDVLQFAKGDGIFESLTVMNNAAHLIMEENEQKPENKRVNLIALPELSGEEDDIARQNLVDPSVDPKEGTEINELASDANEVNAVQLRLVRETTPPVTNCVCCRCS